jgi:hypothetical protein
LPWRSASKLEPGDAGFDETTGFSAGARPVDGAAAAPAGRDTASGFLAVSVAQPVTATTLATTNPSQYFVTNKSIGFILLFLLKWIAYMEREYLDKISLLNKSYSSTAQKPLCELPCLTGNTSANREPITE